MNRKISYVYLFLIVTSLSFWLKPSNDWGHAFDYDRDFWSYNLGDLLHDNSNEPGFMAVDSPLNYEEDQESSEFVIDKEKRKQEKKERLALQKEKSRKEKEKELQAQQRIEEKERKAQLKQREEERLAQIEMRESEALKIKKADQEAKRIEKEEQRQKAAARAMLQAQQKAEKNKAEATAKLEDEDFLENAFSERMQQRFMLIKNRKEELRRNAPYSQEFYDSVLQELQTKNTNQIDIEMVMKGYEIAFDIDLELQSRTTLEGFIFDNLFLVDFFKALLDVVIAHHIELGYYPKNRFQLIIRELLEDENFMLQSNFYESIASFPKEIITSVRDRLSNICDIQQECVHELQSQNMPMDMAESNLNVLTKMLKFIS